MKISPIEVTLLGHYGTDLEVVNAARVSFHKESEWYEDEELDIWPCDKHLNPKDLKLISYLAKHNHKSPFNHCFLSFRIKAPIFVARQLVKHEYLPWNEVSRRYVDEEPEFYFPNNWRKRSDSAKQGSLEEEVEVSNDWFKSMVGIALQTYDGLLFHGVCPEQARMVLPLNTMTEWIWSGTLFAFMKMIKLRLDPHTQLETQEVAQKIANHVGKLFPVSYSELMKV